MNPLFTFDGMLCLLYGRATRIGVACAVVFGLAACSPSSSSSETQPPHAETTEPAVAVKKPPRLSVATPESSGEEPRLKRSFEHSAMYTVFEFILYAAPGERDPFVLEQAAAGAFELIDSLERRISRWLDTSQVSYLNEHAAEGPVKVEKELLDLILYCKELNAQTEGAFDPTVAPLLELWGLYKQQGHMPSPEELDAALALVGMEHVVVDEAASTVRFAKAGVRLDFGGIGKGLALDQAATFLRKYGITSALLVAGGSTLVAIGTPPGEPGWRVEVMDPRDLTQSLEHVLIADESLSTSGCYEPQMQLDGKSLCHIVDPRTGAPIEGMLSASAIAPTGTMTDGLSTAFMVLGRDGIAAFCAAHPDVKAVVIQDRLPLEPEVEFVNFLGDLGSQEQATSID